MSSDARPPAIDVAIVNWNTAEAALAAAGAYLASEGVEARVTIVDNDSRPEQREPLCAGLSRRAFASSCPRRTSATGGPPTGRCATAAPSWSASATPTCCAEPGALAALAAAAGEPQAGMVGPVFGSDTDRYHAALPGTATMLARIFVGSFGERPQPSPGLGEVAEVGQPSGACFVVRREIWEAMGGFDEGFFLWYEDVDLARRLHEAGYRNLVAGSARVGHAGAEAFVQVDRRRLQAIRLDSVERYMRLHHRRAMPIAAPLLRLSRRLRAGGAT